MQGAALIQTLAPHASRVGDLPLSRILDSDPHRAERLALRLGPLYFNFARQRIDDGAWMALLELAGEKGVPAALEALFEGAEVNRSEQRPALHSALRSDLGRSEVARSAAKDARQVRQQLYELLERLAASGVTDLVSIGIGGSDLGPRLAVDALRDFGTERFRVHFLGNVDASAAQHLLRRLDPATSAAVLVSKSFSTQETLLNGKLVRDWLGGDERLYAVSANPDKAAAYGIAAERVLPMWDWVGGRYSLWSAVGFAIAAAIGSNGFDRLLAGAAEMDAHVRHAPAGDNMAVRHALITVWNRNALGYGSHAVLPYDERLSLLPSYLQQLVMESLGKAVSADGGQLAVGTVPVIWGGAGTSVQHSFFQALHQGTDTVPADFIGVATPAHEHRGSHDALLANLLAQAEALANGHAADDPQKRYPGGRPSTLILLDRLDPHSLGMLLALYEHSVYVQSVLWGINAFDQWGVELGKRIAGDLLPALQDDAAEVSDPVTRRLLQEIRSRR